MHEIFVFFGSRYVVSLARYPYEIIYMSYRDMEEKDTQFPSLFL